MASNFHSTGVRQGSEIREADSLDELPDQAAEGDWAAVMGTPYRYSVSVGDWLTVEAYMNSLLPDPPL